MKKQAMKSPVITQLYNQKLIHTAHVKKLQDIKQLSKPHYTIDHKRTNLIDSIRKNKAHTFALNFTINTEKIEHKNSSFAKRITSVKPSSTCQQRNNRTLDEYMMNLSNRSRMSMKEMQRQKQVEKQNQRLYIKLRTASSTLRPDKFKDDFQKSERIKQRIMRYSCDASNPSKVELKQVFGNLRSERYMTLKGSYLSQKSSTIRSQRELASNSVDMKSPGKKNTAQHYNKSDIKNNTIEKINQRYSKILGKMEQKSAILAKNRENQQETMFLTAHSQNNEEGNDNNGYRMTFGRSKISTHLRESLKEKKYQLEENTSTGKSLANPIKKLEKIKNSQKP